MKINPRKGILKKEWEWMWADPENINRAFTWLDYLPYELCEILYSWRFKYNSSAEIWKVQEYMKAHFNVESDIEPKEIEWI